MKTLYKIDRFMAWILLFGVILFFATGYGMTKGVFDSATSANIHNKYLPVIIIFAFVFHAGFATRMAFIRWKWWSWPIKILWALFFLGSLSGFIYLDQWFVKKDVEKTHQNSNNQEVSDSLNQEINSGSPEGDDQSPATKDTYAIKTFSAEDLSKFNGINGSPAYVAVDGVVYDLSSVFDEGKHFSHYAGKELTNAFYSYHAKKVLSKYPVVGEYVGN